MELTSHGAKAKALKLATWFLKFTKARLKPVLVVWLSVWLGFLFIRSYIKYFLYARLNKLFHFMFLFNGKTTTRILYKIRNTVFVLCAWVAIVFVPSLQEVCFAFTGQEVGELKDRSFMVGEGIFKEVGEFHIEGMMCRVKCIDGRPEFYPELDSCISASNNIGLIEGESITHPSAQKNANYVARKTNYSYFVGTKFHFFSYLILGNIFGAVIGLSGVYGFYVFRLKP